MKKEVTKRTNLQVLIIEGQRMELRIKYGEGPTAANNSYKTYAIL
ncbi:MAG: hypothetical protein ABIS36_09735 [Chryseolinea sp.]